MNLTFTSSSERDEWDYLDLFGTLALILTVSVLAVSFVGYLLSLTIG